MNTQKNKINKEINKQNYNQTNTKNKKKNIYIYLYILNIRKDSKTQAPSPKLRSHQLQSPQLQAQPLPTTPGGKGEEGSRERRVESGGYTPKPPEQSPGRQAGVPKFTKNWNMSIFLVFLIFFLHFFIILLARMLKFTKNWKTLIFLEFFYIFLHFACRVPNFSKFW